ncbi:carbohydrate ABC transporter permease [Streptomyces sp. NPDC059904]|uniref:carbohydrate ABC transporter permease n=1 Tax=Streptomyces sp. NPDC059904 TaxID=3346996 RepID=UPI00364A662D
MFTAFGTLLLRRFFMALPRELEEAARIDGARAFPIFWSIMLPPIRPALAAPAVITAMWSWNDLLWPLVVNTDPAKMPTSAGLTSLEGQFETNYPVMMAGSLIASPRDRPLPLSPAALRAGHRPERHDGPSRM